MISLNKIIWFGAAELGGGIDDVVEVAGGGVVVDGGGVVDGATVLTTMVVELARAQ